MLPCRLDRDFQDSLKKKENFIQNREEKRRKHDEKFEKKLLEKLEKQMSNVKVSDSKENQPFLRKPTEKELNQWKENLDREYEAPSSTARMTQANQLGARFFSQIFH